MLQVFADWMMVATRLDAYDDERQDALPSDASTSSWLRRNSNDGARATRLTH